MAFTMAVHRPLRRHCESTKNGLNQEDWPIVNFITPNPVPLVIGWLSNLVLKYPYRSNKSHTSRDVTSEGTSITSMESFRISFWSMKRAMPLVIVSPPCEQLIWKEAMKGSQSSRWVMKSEIMISCSGSPQIVHVNVTRPIFASSSSPSSRCCDEDSEEEASEK
jgi:hypothetical protein